MEEFEINLNGVIYVILPIDPANYIVLQNNEDLGKITAITQDDTSVIWVTADLMSSELAQSIGEEIESYFM